MPSSLSLLVALFALALAVAGASLLAIVIIAIVAVLFEIYLIGSSDGLG